MCTGGGHVSTTVGELQTAEVIEKTPAAVPSTFAGMRRGRLSNLRAKCGLTSLSGWLLPFPRSAEAPQFKLAVAILAAKRSPVTTRRHGVSQGNL